MTWHTVNRTAEGIWSDFLGRSARFPLAARGTCPTRVIDSRFIVLYSIIYAPSL